MTLRMADSVTISNLPAAGYDAYAGYVAGDFLTWPQLTVRFPGKHLLSITPFASFDAEACDCEKGDLTPPQVPGWVKRQLARGEKRPCVYTSVSGMGEIISELKNAGLTRTQVRLWSAHYGLGPHICGPTTCKQISVPMDGTQWTDLAPGAHGSRIDASLLHDDFFTGGTVSATGPEHWDDKDWAAYHNHTRALLATLPTAEKVAEAVIKGLPPAQAGGLTQAEVQAAVAAAFAKAFSA